MRSRGIIIRLGLSCGLGGIAKGSSVALLSSPVALALLLSARDRAPFAAGRPLLRLLACDPLLACDSLRPRPTPAPLLVTLTAAARIAVAAVAVVTTVESRRRGGGGGGLRPEPPPPPLSEELLMNKWYGMQAASEVT